MIQEERLVGLFLRLLEFNAPAKQEKKVVAFTRDLLREAGFEVTEDRAGEKIGGNANNLIVRLPANATGRPSVFLSAHFDTVEPTPGIVVSEVDGVFRTDGTTILGADDRCGVAAAIEALICLRDSAKPHGEVYLLLTVAEEIGLLGAAALDIEALNLDYGFVLDTGPPVGSFVTRAATHDRLEITVRGLAAHAGKEPEKGVDAIVVAAQAISNMKLGRLGPELTANIGMIEGGTATNIVASSVKVVGEARGTDEAQLEAQVDHMIRCFTDAAEARGAELSINHHRHYSGYVVPEDHAVVRIAEAASLAIDLEPLRRTTLGGSDANIYNARGVTCVVLGTGMDKIHTHEEQISRSDLLLTAKIAYECLVQSGQCE